MNAILMLVLVVSILFESSQGQSAETRTLLKGEYAAPQSTAAIRTVSPNPIFNTSTSTSSSATPITVTTTQNPVSTTQNPVSTTTLPINITSTEAPSTTPLPLPQIGKWVVKDLMSNVTCIVAQMALQLNVTYPTQDNKTASVLLDVPGDKITSAFGTCSNLTQSLNLSWAEANVITFMFGANETTNKFDVTSVTVNINVTSFLNVKSKETVITYQNLGDIFSTPLHMSYRCEKTQNFNLSSLDNKLVAVLFVSHTQLQAFKDSDDEVFGDAQDCETLDTPDIVPIAVGCALALLVLIVLAAYLIGRRRSQNRGYLSMPRLSQRYLSVEHRSSFAPRAEAFDEK